MADNVSITEGSGTRISTEEITTLNGGSVAAQHLQRVTPAVRTADGTAADVSSGSPLPTRDAGAVEKLEAIATLLGGTIKIGDGVGSLTVDGTVSVNALPTGGNSIGNVGLIPRASGGLTTFRSLDLDETEEAVKIFPGQVYGYFYANRATTERFLKFYNGTETAVTVGTTAPLMTLPLPEKSAGHVAFPQGIAFSTAITVAATTGLADNNTGAPAEGDVVVNVFYG